MLEIKINIDEIDYSSAVDAIMPLVAEKIENDPEAGFLKTVFAKTSGMSTAMAHAALAVLNDEKKDEIAAALLNKYKDEIAKSVAQELEKKGVSAKITAVDVAAVKKDQ